MGIKNDPCNDTKALNDDKGPRANSFGFLASCFKNNIIRRYKVHILLEGNHCAILNCSF